MLPDADVSEEEESVNDNRTSVIVATTINLRNILTVTSFAMPCKIAFNGYTVAVEALIDTGANAYVIIDTYLAKAFRDRTGAPRDNMEKIHLGGFDGKKSQNIDKITWAHLHIDGRRCRWTPYMEARMSQPLIVGML